jgi:hypothetical protein
VNLAFAAHSNSSLPGFKFLLAKMLISDHSLGLLADSGKFLLGTVVGALVKEKFERKASLVSHWGHTSAFQARGGEGESFTIHTHDVVVRNAGRKVATNVRLSHKVLPEQFNLYPSIPHSVEELPDGTRDIAIPLLVPRQQIIVAYLYYPPLTFADVNAGIRCDEGFARSIEMELAKKTSMAFNWAIAGFFLVGCGTVLYWIWLGASRLGRQFIAAG